jgi:hypothetical protein
MMQENVHYVQQDNGCLQLWLEQGLEGSAESATAGYF